MLNDRLRGVCVWDHYKEVVGDGSVLLAGLGQVHRDHAGRLFLHPEEVGFDHGLRGGHLRGDRDLGWWPVASALGDRGDVDVVGGEGGQVLDSVLQGVVGHKDGDLGDPDGLRDTLCVHKLFVCVVGDLVVDRYQSKRKYGIRKG